jgi:hypothetical protein
MNKVDTYYSLLLTLQSWDEYLLVESNLPGPRGNLELAEAVSRAGDEALFWRYLEFCPEQAPYGKALEFLPFCGILGLGRLLAGGRVDLLPTLRGFASDPRWRLREAVCLALQTWGGVDFNALFFEMERWVHGNLLEKRAAAAALCEPRLLNPHRAEKVLYLLDRITADFSACTSRKQEAFKVLEKGLSYCWSVAVAASPIEGKSAIQKWFTCPDKVVIRVMRENLKKNRLLKLDPDWVGKSRAQIENYLITLEHA